MVHQAVFTQGVPTAALGGGNGCAPTQLDNHLLAVVAGALVSHLLQGAGGLSQQDSSLARGGEEGEGQVAAGQQDGCGSLSLPRQGVQFTCAQSGGRKLMMKVPYLGNETPPRKPSTSTGIFGWQPQWCQEWGQPADPQAALLCQQRTVWSQAGTSNAVFYRDHPFHFTS